MDSENVTVAREAARQRDGRFGVQGAAEADGGLDALQAESWRNQSVVVEGRKFTFADLCNMRGELSTLMHGSRANLEVGDVLEPGKSKRNFKESAEDAVSLCSDEGRAAYWARQTGDGPVFVYEVEPLGEVEPWRVALANYGKGFRMDEGRVTAARIVAKREVELR